jgi:hypothetical protein
MNPDRRRFLGTTATLVAATPFGNVGCERIGAAADACTRPITH